MKVLSTISMLVFAIACFSGITANAATLIGFEDAATYGGDNKPISTQYLVSDNVMFSVLVGETINDAVLGVPTYEAVGHYDGDNAVGFINNELNLVYDVESPSAAGQLGNYFMKSSNSFHTTGYVKLIIDFGEPVLSANGEIWDIDGDPENTEQWQVTAFDIRGQVLSSLISPLGKSYERATSNDGIPWAWDFVEEGGIAKIEVEFIGSKRSGVGLAFDNFSAGGSIITPEPSTMAMVGITLLALLKRKK